MIVAYVCGFLALLVALKYLLKRDCKLPGHGKYIFISGCDTGIGYELAVHFDKLGLQVYAGCLKPDQLEKEFPPAIKIVPLDITNPESVQSALNSVRSDLEKRNTKLWCLINNAGVCVCGEFDWLTWEQCSRVVNVNFLGTMRLTKAFIPLIRKSHGRVVIIGSVNGIISYPGLAVYCATKFALEGFCDALRVELRKFGVRVSLVRPGDLARLTKIMANHEKEASDMWKAMSDEDKLFYNTYFSRFHDATLRNYGLTSPRDFKKSPLVNDVEHAVLHPHPRSRYLSSSLLSCFVYRLIVMLPDPVKDRLLHFATERIIR